MPVTATFEVEGLKELVNQLENLSRRSQRTMLRAGLRKAARPVVNAARAKAPKRTGRGARSIRAVVKGQGKDVVANIGPSAKRWYIGLHEIGFHNRGARPFLRPALDENAEAVGNAFRDAVQEEIDKAIARSAVTDAGSGEEVIE